MDLQYLDLFVQFVLDNYPRDANRDALLRGALHGIVDALGDRYSEYLTGSEYRSLTQDLSGVYGGIGVTIEQIDDAFTVVAPMPGSPAARAGITGGDVITAVDGKLLTGLTVSSVGAMVRGEPGTTVTLSILRRGVPLSFTITRELISIQNISVTTTDDNLAVVAISDFADLTGENFDALITVLRDQGVRGMVLDLRNNPGGYVSEALDVIGQFAAGVTGVQFVGASSTMQLPTTGDGAFAGLPLVVLVNGGSASASEIVAGALQDYDLATVVGEQTFGKGTVQQVLALTNGDGLRLTIAEYLTPFGRKIDGVGVTPDIIVTAGGPTLEPFTYTAPIQIGAVSYPVLQLETLLSQIGIGPGKVDGYYDADTAYAIARLQERNGLPGTGITDQVSVGLLNAAIHEQNAAPAQAQLERALEVLRQQVNAAQASDSR